MHDLPRLAVLISGEGSNLQALIDACHAGGLPAKLCKVISNKPEAGGLSRAARAGIPHACIDHRNYPSRETFDAALLEELRRCEADFAVLAGFMRILTPVFIEPWVGRLLNIHPSLLPKYPGLDTHRRALSAGDTEAGATVHFVTAELDGGPPVLQARVPILGEDDAASLALRVQEREHLIYPLATRWLLEGRLSLSGKEALLDDQVLPETGVVFSEAMALGEVV